MLIAILHKGPAPKDRDFHHDIANDAGKVGVIDRGEYLAIFVYLNGDDLRPRIHTGEVRTFANCAYLLAVGEPYGLMGRHNNPCGLVHFTTVDMALVLAFHDV